MAIATDYVNEYGSHYVLEVQGNDLGVWFGDAIEWPVETSTVVDPQFGEEPNGGRQTTAEVTLNRPSRRSGRPTFGSDARTLQYLRSIGGRARCVVKHYELDDDGIRQSPPLGVHAGTVGPCTGPGASDSSDGGTIEVTLQVKR
jgi:hypothetical protein